MLYLANGSSVLVRAAMTRGQLGQLCTPLEGRSPLPGVVWAADNSCFGKSYPGDAAWLAWLARHAAGEHLARCLFAVAPDVVGDADATLARSSPFLPVIRDLGYAAAYVAQDGLDPAAAPWDTFDVLFIGGSTDYKLGPAAAAAAAEAHRRGKRVHMGRVNSRRRWSYADYLGCESCDGTKLAFGPDVNLRQPLSWHAQPGLFDYLT